MLRSRTDNNTQKRFLESDWLLLVEGKDEKLLFENLIEFCLGKQAGIQIIDAGGVNKFPLTMKAIESAMPERPTLRSVGVVRDADDNPNSAFESVCANLRNAGFETSVEPGEFSNAIPSVGVFIVPDIEERGAIETLCRRSVEDSPAALCVEQYLKCLTENRAMHSKIEDKSFVHAYLASLSDPMVRVGEGAQNDVWKFDSPAFRNLSRFIRDLHSR